MTRQIALLRGINVGGNRKLPMAGLRAGLEATGCTDVVTYIQSGNVVFTPPSPRPDDLQAWVEAAIADVAGFPVPVVLRSRVEMQGTVDRNPYPTAGGTQLHVVFFAQPPESDVLTGIDLASFAPEECTLRGADLYLHLPDGMGRAKLPVALEKAGRRSSAVGTARNWNTVLKLVDLSAG